MIKESKICIGTANFGKKYGRYNNYIINKNEIKKILIYCKEKGINSFDSAINYESEKIIGKLKPKNWHNLKIDTKIPNVPKNIVNIDKWLNKLVNSSINSLGVSNINILYLHNSNMLFQKNGPYIYDTLKNIKKKGLIKKIGVSIYNPKEFYRKINKYKIDIIQTPMSYCDQTIIKNNYYKKIKLKRINIYLRSIFLQGALLLENIDKYKKNKPLIKYLHDLKKIIKNKQINEYDLALNFILKYNFFNKIVLGIDNLEQLKKFHNFKKYTHSINYLDLATENEKIIYPYNW